MDDKLVTYTAFHEDDIDIDKIKRTMSTVSFVRTRNRKRIFILSVVRFVIFFVSLFLFLFLFSMASEVISLF
ncbi:MAG: hypothetical protein FWC71_06610 [Defluviitaleaceae bacterium]|nr:hypothetical protein [Defluviitaleaceae bacterium]